MTPGPWPSNSLGSSPPERGASARCWGAGASRAAGLPDLQQLQDAVKASSELDADQKVRVAALLAGRNLEDVLS